MDAALARALWRSGEPLHALTVLREVPPTCWLLPSAGHPAR